MGEIGKRIEKSRKDHHYTQKEFAEHLGVTNAHISKLEKGITNPSDALIKLICRVFDVNEEWLRYGKDPVYLDELIIATDDLFSQSTKFSRKRLQNQPPIIRWKFSQVEHLMCKILTLDFLKDNEKVTYLNLQIELLEKLVV